MLLYDIKVIVEMWAFIEFQLWFIVERHSESHVSRIENRSVIILYKSKYREKIILEFSIIPFLIVMDRFQNSLGSGLTGFQRFLLPCFEFFSIFGFYQVRVLEVLDFLGLGFLDLEKYFGLG